MKSLNVIFLVLGMAFTSLFAHEPEEAKLRKVMGLNGTWLFSVGDAPQWAYPDFDDRSWETIEVPGPWENQGFNGYDGYAWYRQHISTRGLPLEEDLYLSLGYIDDVDQVFVNGEMIGFSGGFPPHFSTAFRSKRLYRIPRGLLQPDRDNVIAIRVFDKYIDGGIMSGDIGIYAEKKSKELVVDLAGLWHLYIGDIPLEGPEPPMDEWNQVMVPDIWDNQGYRKYDGFAWYKKTFECPIDVESGLLLMGKIDDYDQVFLNGQLIGMTGWVDPYTMRKRDGWAWQQTRVYVVPPGLLNPGGQNEIQVRVYDFTEKGGIYEGPIGIIQGDNLTRFYREWREY